MHPKEKEKGYTFKQSDSGCERQEKGLERVCPTARKGSTTCLNCKPCDVTVVFRTPFIMRVNVKL